MKIKNVLVGVVLFIFVSGYSQIDAKFKLDIGNRLSYIISPETNEHNFKKEAFIWGFDLGPRVDVGGDGFRIALAAFGAYNSSETLWSLIDPDDYKFRRSWGYGSSLLFKIASPNQIGVSFGVGYENLKTFYKIPKNSEVINDRFHMYYGQLGVTLYDEPFNVDLYFKYGRGQNKANFIGIGMTLGIGFTDW